MAVRQRRYSKEEMAGRGQELYESGFGSKSKLETRAKLWRLTSKPEPLSLMKMSYRQRIGCLSNILTLNLG